MAEDGNEGYRKTQRFPVIEGRYLTTEITEGAENTEISTFSLRPSSALKKTLSIKFFLISPKKQSTI